MSVRTEVVFILGAILDTAVPRYLWNVAHSNFDFSTRELLLVQSHFNLKLLISLHCQNSSRHLIVHNNTRNITCLRFCTSSPGLEVL